MDSIWRSERRPPNLVPEIRGTSLMAQWLSLSQMPSLGLSWTPVFVFDEAAGGGVRVAARLHQEPIEIAAKPTLDLTRRLGVAEDVGDRPHHLQKPLEA